LENENFNTSFLGMSCHIWPLDRPTVRRAIFLGINKKELAQAAFRFDTVPLVTNNYIPARLPGFFPVDDKAGFNPEAGRAILRQEGFPEGITSLPLNVFFARPKRDEDPKLFRALSDQLALLGIKARMKYYGSLKDLRPLKEPYLVMINWMMDFPDPENIILPIFLSSSFVNMNLLRYSNPQLDELAQKAEAERSWAERISLFHKMEDVLFVDVPAIPLFSSQQRVALQPYVRGAKIPPLGLLYLDVKEIWLAR
jgi:ABC-type transport system substrate-binding protein